MGMMQISGIDNLNEPFDWRVHRVRVKKKLGHLRV